MDEGFERWMGCIYVWINDVCMNGMMVGGIVDRELMCRWISGQTKRWINEWLMVHVGGLVDGWMNNYTNGN